MTTASMSFRIVDSVDQKPRLPIDSPYGYPELAGWRITADAGPLGVEVHICEMLDPSRMHEEREFTLFAAWDDLADHRNAVADVRRLIRTEVQNLLVGENAYDPQAESPQ